MTGILRTGSLYFGVQLSRICEEICDRCLASNTVEAEGIGCDNMTILIVQVGIVEWKA